MNLKEEILILREENARLRAENAELKKLLQEALDKLNKNSNNSSKPPSTDIVRTKSLRISSGKNPGGQKGHAGTTLPLSKTPDKIVEHRAMQCRECGKDISGVGSKRYERRQVYDIPPIRMQVTEHRSEIKCCPHCQAENRGTFPEGVSGSTQYGVNLKSFGVYLTQYQLLPFHRSMELIEEITGHRVSVGTLAGNNNHCKEQLGGFEEALKEHLKNAPLIHSDETGFYYEGKRKWLHTATTKDCTYYYAHDKRGKTAMDDMGILAGYEGTVMHDYWKSYLDYGCTHALCNAHHLRDLTFCHEQEQSQWAADMKALLLAIKQETDDCKASGLQSLDEHRRQVWAQKYDLLIQQGYSQHPLPEKQVGKRGSPRKTKTQNMLQRFEKHKEDILRFMINFSIPFDNNLAEQAIRMMKVKQKISGCFRSKDGASSFAIIRSYIDTMRKNGYAIMDAIGLAVAGKPIIPFLHPL